MQLTKALLRKVHCKNDLSPVAPTTRNLFTRIEHYILLFSFVLAAKEGSVYLFDEYSFDECALFIVGHYLVFN